MLYSKYGRFKSVLATLHAMGQNHITEKTLENHLRSELAYITAEEANRAANAQAITQTQPETAPMAHIAPLQEEANKVYAEMGALHSRLLVVNDQERKDMAGRILQLQNKWVQLMRKIDNPELSAPVADERASVPVNPPQKTTEAKKLSGEDYQELMNLRSKVTRAEREQIPAYQAKLEKGDNPNVKRKLEERIKELAIWKARIIELETLRHEG